MLLELDNWVAFPLVVCDIFSHVIMCEGKLLSENLPLAYPKLGLVG